MAKKTADKKDFNGTIHKDQINTLTLRQVFSVQKLLRRVESVAAQLPQVLDDRAPPRRHLRPRNEGSASAWRPGVAGGGGGRAGLRCEE